MRHAFPLVVTATLALAAAACGDDTPSVPDGSPPATLTLAPANPRPTIFVPVGLGIGPTTEQKQLTEEILREDPSVRALIGGSPIFFGQMGLHVDESGPESGDEILLGTIAQVFLSQPGDRLDVEVPQARARQFYGYWPDDLQARYSPWVRGTEVLSVRNLSEFQATVDLFERRVVDIDVFSLQGNDQEIVQATLGSGVPSPDLFDLGAAIQAAQQTSDEVESIAEDDPAVAAILEALQDEERPRGRMFEFGEHRFGRYSIYAHRIAELQGDWPVIVDQDPATGDYRSEIIHVVRDSANEVYVTVDLDVGSVIDIETHERD